MRKLALMESTLLLVLPFCFDFVGWTMWNLLPIYVCMDETIVCLLLDMLASYICCIWTFDLLCICVGWSYPYGRDMIWYVYVLVCLSKVFSHVCVCVFLDFDCMWPQANFTVELGSQENEYDICEGRGEGIMCVWMRMWCVGGWMRTCACIGSVCVNIDTDNRQTDVSLQRIYWSFQLKLLNINGRGLNLFCRFNHHNGQLDIPEVYKHLFANDILITDPTTTELEPVGIRGNATSYKVIRLNRTQLILVSEADSLVFRKIAL